MPITDFTAADVADQKGRSFFITGANTGLGFETAKVLALRGARVVLGCRSEEKGHAAMARILEGYSDADLGFVQIDMADLDSIRQAAKRVASDEHIDTLINNAGIMMAPRELTRDGFESHFGVNHLGGFALTGILLPLLAEKESARIVLTSSNAHWGGRIDFDDIRAERSYSKFGRYAMSKLANLLHMYDLDRRLRASDKTITVVGCHPGMASTDLSRHMPSWTKQAIPFLSSVFNDAASGAWGTLYAATAPDIASGSYCGPSKKLGWAGPVRICGSSAQARDPDLGRRLWEVSVSLTGVDPELPAA